MDDDRRRRMEAEETALTDGRDVLGALTHSARHGLAKTTTLTTQQTDGETLER